MLSRIFYLALLLASTTNVASAAGSDVMLGGASTAVASEPNIAFATKLFVDPPARAENTKSPSAVVAVSAAQVVRTPATGSAPATIEVEKTISAATGATEPNEYVRLWGDHGIKISDALLILFTALLAWFTCGLWASTRALWKETKQGGATAEISAKAAQTSAAAARDLAAVSIAAEQPRFIVRSMTLWMTGASPSAGQFRGSIRVDLVNHGRTPAEITRTAFRYVVVKELDVEPHYPSQAVENANEFGQVIDPNSNIIVGDSICLTLEEVEAISRGDRNLFAFGYIAYADLRDDVRVKGFVGILNAKETRWDPGYVSDHPSGLGGNSGGKFQQPPVDDQLQAYTYTRLDTVGGAGAG